MLEFGTSLGQRGEALDDPILQLWCKHARQGCLLQGHVQMMAPYILVVLRDLIDAQPALAGRLKVAAMQLLPPLLDGLHARRLAGHPDSGWSAECLHQWIALNSGVSTSLWLSIEWIRFRDSCLAGPSACASCLLLPHNPT